MSARVAAIVGLALTTALPPVVSADSDAEGDRT